MNLNYSVICKTKKIVKNYWQHIFVVLLYLQQKKPLIESSNPFSAASESRRRCDCDSQAFRTNGLKRAIWNFLRVGKTEADRYCGSCMKVRRKERSFWTNLGGTAGLSPVPCFSWDGIFCYLKRWILCIIQVFDGDAEPTELNKIFMY